MPSHLARVLALYSAAVLVLLPPDHQPLAVERQPHGRFPSVAGLVVAKGDSWIQVSLDGEAKTTNFVLPDNSNKAAHDALRFISPFNRVEVTYAPTGDSHEIVKIRKQRPTSKGIVGGEVIDNHGWWVDVQPENGPREGYAARIPKSGKSEILDELGRLRAGDIVLIRFHTDATGHHIQSIWKTGGVKRERQTVGPPS